MKTAEMAAVRKAFGPTEALADFDLSLDEGEILALLGPNGAGKTTAINVLTGLRRPDSGSVALFGQPPNRRSVRCRIGLTPQESGVPPTLRVAEVFRLVRAHFPEPLSDEQLFDRFPIRDLWRRQAGGLSGGQKRMVAVALAFSGNPELVFLDEPTTGLDVEARRALWDSIRAYREVGGTVVLTTHYLEEAEALASRVVVVSQGRSVADGDVETIRRRVGQQRVSFRGEVSSGLPGVLQVDEADGYVSLLCNDSDELVRALVKSGAAFSDLSVRRANLEEAFVALTAGKDQ